MVEIGNTEDRMGVGKLKMLNPKRGPGFIAPDAGGSDKFFHINERAEKCRNSDEIKTGNIFAFKIATTREGKTRAINIRMG